MQLAATRMKHHPSREGLTRQTQSGRHIWTGEVRFNEQWIRQPLHWEKPRMIFVCAHGDLFHEGVPDEWIDRVFAIMADCPQHTFQVLTKRPERMLRYLRDLRTEEDRRGQVAGWLKGNHGLNGASSAIRLNTYPLPNVWLGVSVENQKTADERIRLLLQAPAAVRWVSAEPLLGPIDLRPEWLACQSEGQWLNIVECGHGLLRWMVAGGESGHNARPTHPDWLRSLRDQCSNAPGVSFLFKQWGEWVPEPQVVANGQRFPMIEPGMMRYLWPDGHECNVGQFGNQEGDFEHGLDNAERVYRVGKKAAGRHLDGRLWDEYPVRSLEEVD
jgi:protein gp37